MKTNNKGDTVKSTDKFYDDEKDLDDDDDEVQIAIITEDSHGFLN